MKKIAIVLLAIIFASLSIISCQKAGEDNGKKEEQVQREQVKQQPSEIKTEVQAKQKEQPSVKPEAGEPQLIWQKDFGAEIRGFKMHKTIGAEDFPIMAVETEDKLIIFDKKGNETIKRQIPKLELEQKGKKEAYRWFVIVSDNGKYVLEGSGVPEFSADIKYTTVNGKLLWEEKNFSGLPVVSPDGSVVVLLDTSTIKEREIDGGIARTGGSVKFYDRTGKLLKQHFIDISSIEMPLYRFAFSEDGNYFVLRVEQWIEDKIGRRAIYPIILFDKKGTFLWQKNIEVTPGKTPPFELLISPHGRYISYSSDKFIFTLDVKGNLLWKKASYSLLSFSKKEKLLIKSKIFSLVDSLTGDGIQVLDLGPVSIPFKVSPIISPDETSIAILVAAEIIGGKETFYILNLANKEIKIILKKEYPYYLIRNIQFSADSNYLYLLGQEETKLSVYKVALKTID